MLEGSANFRAAVCDLDQIKCFEKLNNEKEKHYLVHREMKMKQDYLTNYLIDIATTFDTKNRNPFHHTTSGAFFGKIQHRHRKNMNNKVFQQKLKRILCQIQYRPNLSWFNDRAVIAQNFEAKYKEWDTSNGNVALFSPDERKALEVFTNTLNYINEKEIDITECEEHVSTVLDKLIEDYKIKEVRRIGFRRTEVLSTKFQFNELVELIHQKFYTLTKEIASLQAGKVHDISFVLDTMEGNIKTHIQLGPVHKEEGEQYFAKDAKFSNPQKIDSECNLFIDLDVSIVTSLTAQNSIENLIKVIKANTNTFEKYIEYMSN